MPKPAVNVNKNHSHLTAATQTPKTGQVLVGIDDLRKIGLADSDQPERLHQR